MSQRVAKVGPTPTGQHTRARHCGDLRRQAGELVEDLGQAR
jgi:hypothetical protein